MKKSFLLIFACGMYCFSFAQTKTTTVDYQKQTRTALVNDVPFPSKTIEDAIEDTLSKMGYKSSNAKGFIVYKGVQMAALGQDAYDIYFMVDKKSRKDKDNSVVTMMLSKGFDTFLDEQSDKNVFEKAKAYMDSLRNMVAVYDLEQQIITQEEEVKKADKKNVDLQDESKDLEKKRRKLNDQIEENSKDLANQAKEIEKQKQILETLKAKRRY